MKNIIYIIAVISASLVLFSSCGHKHADGDGHNHGTTAKHSDDDGHDHGSAENKEEESHKEGLFLTEKQAKTIGLEFGDLSSVKENDFVKSTGTLGIPPNAYSAVTAKTNGILKSSKKFIEGEYIKKGTVIASLENPEFIKMQQQYLETMAQLKLKRLEVQRQRTLVAQNAGVTKNLQNAQAEVAILEATTTGLSKQLSYLGISTDNLTTGSIRQQISIVAPMSGYISKINFHNGMYAQSSASLMDIISTDHLHLELDVFEKDIAQIKEDQKITYTVPALGNEMYNGEVKLKGLEFNTNTKTVRVHGHLEGKQPPFVKDLFVNAKIWLNDSTSTALPEKAIIRDGESAFVYVGKKEDEGAEIKFEKINVVLGGTSDGFTSVDLIDAVPEGMRIVTEGAYYIYAQSKAGELSHEH